MQNMKKTIELLEKALREAGCVEVLGVCDRAHLNKVIGYVKEALEELCEQSDSDGHNKEAI
jgi:hypothetical protein